MLFPIKTKFKKQRKGRIKGAQAKGSTLSFGQYGLQAVTSGRISSKQIEASRRAIVRKIKKSGKLWLRVFPDVPVTKKPSEVRMGKGKGPVDRWVCKIRPGKMLFELSELPEDLAKQALKGASAKLGVISKFVSQYDTARN